MEQIKEITKENSENIKKYEQLMMEFKTYQTKSETDLKIKANKIIDYEKKNQEQINSLV